MPVDPGPLPIVVYGAGGHAKVVAQTLARSARWRLAGFIDDLRPERRGEPFAGASVLGGAGALDALRRDGVGHAIVAFGHNEARQRVAGQLATLGFRLPTIIDVHAIVADDASFGDGCYLAEGAVVHSGSRVGAHTIVNTGAVVEHDVAVGEAVHLGPRVCLAGHVQVGTRAWIGMGALVRDRVHVGADAVVGMGAVVLRDVPDGWVAYGAPARAVHPVKP